MFSSDTMLPWAALLAFAAFGANLLGTVLLLLINPRSRAVQWHAVFTCFVMGWLALQGWFTLGLTTAPAVRAYGWIVHLMPAAFLAESLVQTHGIRNRTALLVLVASAATAPVLNPVVAGWPAITWQAALWGGGAWLHFAHGRKGGSRADGIDRARLIVDPGIGFGKMLEHNLTLLKGLALFHGLGAPILLGASRKRFIGTLSGVEVAGQRMAGSLAVALHASGQGAQVLRVHDVTETVQGLALWRAMTTEGA